MLAICRVFFLRRLVRDRACGPARADAWPLGRSAGRGLCRPTTRWPTALHYHLPIAGSDGHSAIGDLTYIPFNGTFMESFIAV